MGCGENEAKYSFLGESDKRAKTVAQGEPRGFFVELQGEGLLLCVCLILPLNGRPLSTVADKNHVKFIAA